MFHDNAYQPLIQEESKPSRWLYIGLGVLLLLAGFVGGYQAKSYQFENAVAADPIEEKKVGTVEQWEYIRTKAAVTDDQIAAILGGDTYWESNGGKDTIRAIKKSDGTKYADGNAKASNVATKYAGLVNQNKIDGNLMVIGGSTALAALKSATQEVDGATFDLFTGLADYNDKNTIGKDCGKMLAPASHPNLVPALEMKKVTNVITKIYTVTQIQLTQSANIAMATFSVLSNAVIMKVIEALDTALGGDTDYQGFLTNKYACRALGHIGWTTKPYQDIDTDPVFKSLEDDWKDVGRWVAKDTFGDFQYETCSIRLKVDADNAEGNVLTMVKKIVAAYSIEAQKGQPFKNNDVYDKEIIVNGMNQDARVMLAVIGPRRATGCSASL